MERDAFVNTKKHARSGIEMGATKFCCHAVNSYQKMNILMNRDGDSPRLGVLFFKPYTSQCGFGVESTGFYNTTVYLYLDPLITVNV